MCQKASLYSCSCFAASHPVSIENPRGRCLVILQPALPSRQVHSESSSLSQQIISPHTNGVLAGARKGDADCVSSSTPSAIRVASDTCPVSNFLCRIASCLSALVLKRIQFRLSFRHSLNCVCVCVSSVCIVRFGFYFFSRSGIYHLYVLSWYVKCSNRL